MPAKKALARGFAVGGDKKATAALTKAAFIEGKPGGGSRRRRDLRAGVDTERLTLWVPRALAMEVRIHCTATQQSLSTAAADAFALWLEQQKK